MCVDSANIHCALQGHHRMLTCGVTRISGLSTIIKWEIWNRHWMILICNCKQSMRELCYTSTFICFMIIFLSVFYVNHYLEITLKLLFLWGTGKPWQEGDSVHHLTIPNYQQYHEVSVVRVKSQTCRVSIQLMHTECPNRASWVKLLKAVK